MRKKVFVKLPFNTPSGGVKVANQLVNLFREHDYESYIVLQQKTYLADWLINPAPTINVKKMEELCDSDDIIIDNWIDRDGISQTKRSKAHTKIFYSQGCTFYKSKTLVGDEFLRNDFGYTHFWTVSTDSLYYLEARYKKIKKWYLVHPYLEFESAKNIAKGIERKDKILAFLRKGESYIRIADMIYGSRTKFDTVDRFSETQAYKLYASHKFFLATAIGASQKRQHLINIAGLFRYGDIKHVAGVVGPGGGKEGFPLPPAEAAVCGSIVIGFAMGGGLEWMSPSTCFLAKDRSYASFIEKINEALSTPDDQLETIRKNAFNAVSRFKKENTWRQISEFLKEI